MQTPYETLQGVSREEMREVIRGGPPRKPERVLQDHDVGLTVLLQGDPKYEDFPLDNRMRRRAFEDLCFRVAKRQIKAHVARLAKGQVKTIPVEVASEEMQEGA